MIEPKRKEACHCKSNLPLDIRPHGGEKQKGVQQLPLYVTVDPALDCLSCGTLNRRYVADTNCASPTIKVELSDLEKIPSKNPTQDL